MPRLPHPRTALSGYADARLPQWRRAAVERHLRRCTRCAVEVGQIRALGDLLRTAGPVPGPPTALVDRLLALRAPRLPDQPDHTDQTDPPDLADPPDAGTGTVDRVTRPRPVPAARRPPQPRARAGVEAASVLVAGVIVLGTVAAGAAVTAATVPWPTVSTRASLSSVLTRLWTGDAERGGAVSVPPVDNGHRP